MKNQTVYAALKSRAATTFAMLLAICVCLTSCNAESQPKAGHADDQPRERWSEEKANSWYAEQPWIVGCNFVPSTAINQIEMWQKDTFDPETIDRELGWASDLGFNAVRIFFHNLVWEENPDEFKGRVEKFLEIAATHGIRVIPTLFTNGAYHESSNPQLGKQKNPIPGVHNSGWVQAPGADIVNDSTKWGVLEDYVKDVIGSFGEDQRVLFWSVYNEPEVTTRGAQCLPLLHKVFEWARSVDPVQPLSAPIAFYPMEGKSRLEVLSFLGENCDIITFHSYSKPEKVENLVKRLQGFNRPIICTEYMARTAGSTFEGIMPIFKSENVGAISFGLVAGKGNFYYPGGSKEGSPEPEVWFHDILRGDGTPYDQAEVDFIKNIIARNN